MENFYSKPNTTIMEINSSVVARSKNRIIKEKNKFDAAV